MLKVKLTLLLLIVITLNSFAQETPKPTPHWRPQYHFSPPTNWTNDPNGLIFLNGVFQLYYQHNPFENKWGHMSWGHATSTDLIHWKNLPVAIPEVAGKDTTTWIYSGSTVLDTHNTSGLGVKGKAPLVAIYTADQPKQKKESQFIAYSTDGGLTFKQYAHNPVIDLNKRDFRDPNVFWYAPTKQWIMTVAMVDEHMVRIYGSKNLRDWTKLSDFGPAGYTKNGWECPSLLPIAVDHDPKKVKWVLLVSSGGDHGPLMQYFVGDFDGTHFKNSNANDQVLTVDHGDAFYAAIAWRDAPAKKTILLGWLQSGKPETYPWKGQMSIPRDLQLKTTSEGIRLFQPPSSMISNSLSKYAKGGVVFKQNMGIDNKAMDLALKGRFANNHNWIDAEIKLNNAAKVGFNLTEQKGLPKRVVVGYDVLKQELFVDCTASEKENKSPENLIQAAKMSAPDGVVKIQVLLDGSSLEVIGNGGERVISTMIYPDKDATGFSAFADGKAIIKSLKIWDLSQP